MSATAVIIPARYGSTRLPGKPLIPLAGRPMIQWVYQRACEIKNADRVLVATDDSRIETAVRAFGGEVVMTPPELASGSERVGWAARDLEVEIVVNLQGDEPLISAAAVSQAIAALQTHPNLPAATLATPLASEEEWRDPSVVKVLVNERYEAIYFSRAPIPYHRDRNFAPFPGLYRHLGVYVFRKSFLMDYLAWPISTLEEREKLEQLRILQKGHRILVVETDQFSPGVDTAEDIQRVEAMINERGLEP